MKNKRTTSWLTLSARVDASFWTSKRNNTDKIDQTEELVAAKVAVIPRNTTSGFRIEFDLTVQKACQNLSLHAMKVAYQAMVPDDSEIFRIASHGKVEELIAAVCKGTARLTDRDTAGRSLLNVSNNHGVKKTELTMYSIPFRIGISK